MRITSHGRGSIEERILASGFARECAPSVESTIEMQRANQSATEILLKSPAGAQGRRGFVFGHQTLSTFLLRRLAFSVQFRRLKATCDEAFPFSCARCCGAASAVPKRNRRPNPH